MFRGQIATTFDTPVTWSIGELQRKQAWNQRLNLSAKISFVEFLEPFLGDGRNVG
jgi:hypothetical protein